MFRREKSLKGTGSVAQKIYITLQAHLSAKPTIFDLTIYDFLGATKAILSTEDTKGFLTQFHPSNTEHTRSYKIAACHRHKRDKKQQSLWFQTNNCRWVQRSGNYVEWRKLTSRRGVNLLQQLRRTPPIHPPPELAMALGYSWAGKQTNVQSKSQKAKSLQSHVN